MIWQLLGTAIQVGGNLLAGGLQRRDLRESEKKAQYWANLRRSDELAARSAQEALGFQAQNLAKEQFGFQKTQARQATKMAKEQMKQDKVNRMLGMLGNNTSLKNSVLDMWSKTGLAG